MNCDQGLILKLNFVRPLAFALCLFATGLPLAADSLAGRVLDPQGAAVPNADLSLYDRVSGNLRKATSSSTGEFSFPDIDGGTYLLQAQTTGSSLAGSEEITVAGTTIKDLPLSLGAATQRLVISATGTPVFEQEVARNIDVVDAQQINERDEYSVGEALRAMPGIQIQTQVGGVTQIRTRGLPNQYTAVLIDGMRFRDAVGTQADASGFMSDMNVTDLGRMEFMRGSGSSLYGTNAIGGAINLASNDGGGKFHANVRAEGGQLGFFRGTANVSGGVKNDRFVYTAGASSLNVTGGVRGSTPNKNNSGQAFGKYNFSPKISLSGRVWGADAFQRSTDSAAFPASVLPNFPATGIIRAIPLADDQIALYEKRLPYTVGNANFIPSVPDPDASRNSSFNATMLSFRQEITPNTSWRASYSLVNTKRAFIDGPAGVSLTEPAIPNISDFNGRTNQLQLKVDSAALKLNRLTGGYEFEREAIYSTNTHVQVNGPIAATQAYQHSHAFYGQDQIGLLNGKLQIVFGGRVQKYDLKQPDFTTPVGAVPSPYVGVAVTSPDTSYTGDLSVAYFVASTNTKIRAHMGNGYRAPALSERFGGSFNSSTGNFGYNGDPRLGAEKSRSYDGGIDQWLYRNKIRASATYFYTDLNPTILFTSALVLPDPFGRTSGYRLSGGGGVSRGAEFNTQLIPTSTTSITMSYTYVNADQRSPTATILGVPYFSALRTAKHMFSMVVTQWVTKRLNVTGDFYAIDAPVENPFGANRLFAYPGPKKLDLVVNYKVPINDKYSMDIYTKIENIANYRYTDNGFLAPQAWAIGGIKFNF